MSHEAADHVLATVGEPGGLPYGEHVTPVEHALQCATLAELEEVAVALVVAALLHGRTMRGNRPGP